MRFNRFRRATAFVVCVLAFSASPSTASDLPIGAQFAVAIEDDDLDAVKALVAAGNSPDTWIDYGANSWSVLMKASWDGRLEIARYLLDHGADVNSANADKETALHQALGREQTAVVELLLERGAKVDAVDSRDFWPIHKAAAAGNVEIIRLLARAKSPLEPEMYGLTPLMFAVSAGKEEAVRALVEEGAKVGYASRTGNVGQTALYSAIQTANSAMIELLLELGADPSARLADGSSLVDFARQGDQKAIAARLEEEIAARGGSSGSAAKAAAPPAGLTFEQAIERKNVEAVRQFLAVGAAVDTVVDDYGTTLLHRAVDSGEVEIVRALLDADANPNVANQYKITPLMSAALEGRLEMVRALIGHGARVIAREPNGGSALMFAVLRGHTEVVRTLIAAGAEVDRDRAVLLEIAGREGHAEIVELLAGN